MYRRSRYAVVELFVALYGSPWLSISALGVIDGGPSRVSKSLPSPPCSVNHTTVFLRYR